MSARINPSRKAGSPTRNCNGACSASRSSIRSPTPDTQILDTFIEREELKQRINSQEHADATIQIELPEATAQAAREAGL